MMNKKLDLVKSCVRDIPDFPKPGILFRDITPILSNAAANVALLDLLEEQAKLFRVDGILGVESRGFLYGQALAIRMNVPFYLARKKGKLPAEILQASYDLEYGSATLEVHKDSIPLGANILVHDDILATGGTAEAASKLVELSGANVSGFLFIIRLLALRGQERLPYTSASVIDY
jgi:adenine phosphoribosyltransferase